MAGSCQREVVWRGIDRKGGRGKEEEKDERMTGMKTRKKREITETRERK